MASGVLVARRCLYALGFADNVVFIFVTHCRGWREMFLRLLASKSVVANYSIRGNYSVLGLSISHRVEKFMLLQSLFRTSFNGRINCLIMHITRLFVVSNGKFGSSVARTLSIYPDCPLPDQLNQRSAHRGR